MFGNLFARMFSSLRLSDVYLYVFDDGLLMINIVIMVLMVMMVIRWLYQVEVEVLPRGIMSSFACSFCSILTRFWPKTWNIWFYAGLAFSCFIIDLRSLKRVSGKLLFVLRLPRLLNKVQTSPGCLQITSGVFWLSVIWDSGLVFERTTSANS